MKRGAGADAGDGNTIDDSDGEEVSDSDGGDEPSERVVEAPVDDGERAVRCGGW